MRASEFRQLIEIKGKEEAVSIATGVVCKTEQAADDQILSYVNRLLNNERYSAAGMVLWGPRLLTCEPYAVKLVWGSIIGHPLVLLQGGSGEGKSYSAIVWLFLDWLRDPAYTNVKVVSTTAGHAKANTFANMSTLLDGACVRIPAVNTQDYIGLDPRKRNSGFSIIAIPDGDTGKGALQGFHPLPRPRAHPILGPVSRVRAFLDELEQEPVGVWEGVKNMKSSLRGADTVKIIGAYNPHDISSKAAQEACPVGGWDAFDVDTGVDGRETWTSQAGWFVCRIDPAKTENIIQRKEVYPGFHSWEGFQSLMEQDGGNTAAAYTFGRGAYPPQSAVRVIVQSGVLSKCRGEFIFSGKTVNCAGADIAVDGRDKAVLAVGRFGQAMAFQPRGGPLINFPKARNVLQIDQLYTLKKGTVKIVGDDIKQHCVDMGIDPEWFMCDSTGNGAQVHGYLQAVWGEAVGGIDFNGNPTTTKILEQHNFTPEEKYDGIVTEVWFGMAAWMEYGYLAISPNVRSDPVESELLGRRYKNIGKKMVNNIAREMIRVEKKDEYIIRLHHSPDFADAITILAQRVRTKAAFVASMTGEPMVRVNPKPQTTARPKLGIVDRIEWFRE